MPQFPDFFTSSLANTSNTLTSKAPIKDIQAAPVGAGVAEVGIDQFLYHRHLIKWIEETKQKLPNATSLLRREAFLADPLLKGTIYPYLKNVLLQGFLIQTKDNKLYEAAIEEITDYLEEIELMQVFREDFLHFAILDGHSYRRMDPDKKGNIVRLEKLEPSSMTVYNDPWNSSIVSYHQRARVKTTWSISNTTQTVDSWFIPYGDEIKDERYVKGINKTYIEGRQSIDNYPDVFNLFKEYQGKYSISDTLNLRIASSERVLAMHNVERVQSIYAFYYESSSLTPGTGQELYNPAPIDTVLLDIWLKRLLLVNAPNLIFIILSPFLHLKSGIMRETTDAAGNKVLTSSIPQKPSKFLQQNNPEIYNKMLQDFTNWMDDTKKSMHHIMDCLKNGGVFATGPDQEIKPIESARSASYQLIQGLLKELNEEIGQAFGFPMALVLATGTELASSRNILQMFNQVHAGERTEYETTANRLIKMVFEGRTWKGVTQQKDEAGIVTETEINYSFEDIKAKFVLDSPDTKDDLQEANAENFKAQTLAILKNIGASTEDLQALADEAGFGILDLDRKPQNQPEENNKEEDPAQITAILKSILAEVFVEKGLIPSVEPFISKKDKHFHKHNDSVVKETQKALEGDIDELAGRVVNTLKVKA